MRAGLVADTYLQAMSITQTKKRYDEYVSVKHIFSTTAFYLFLLQIYLKTHLQNGLQT